MASIEKMDRKVKYDEKATDGDHIKISSVVEEKMSKDEFRTYYSSNGARTEAVKSEIDALRQQLNKVKDIKETEELKKMAELFDEARKLSSKMRLQADLREKEQELHSLELQARDINKAFVELRESGVYK